jgi:hypothetical protein
VGQAAAHDVDQQALVGFGAALLEGRLQVEVQRDLLHLHAAAGFLGHELQLDRFLRLQFDHEAVGDAAGRAGEQRERRVGEFDDDLRRAARHALAGAQVERHLGPAPGVDEGAQGDEGFGLAVGRDVLFFVVARHFLVAADAAAVLAAHRVARDVGQAEAAQRAQHLQLFVAHGVRRQRGRRLHRDDAQQLQQVVLDHVAHRAGAVVEAGAAADADFLGHRDLHARDVRRAPQRFQDRVPEAQHHQVLHGFLAEVVVDAVDLRFGEVLADRLVDLDRRREVGAERLFQHDAGVGVDQAGGASLSQMVVNSDGAVDR